MVIITDKSFQIKVLYNFFCFPYYIKRCNMLLFKNDTAIPHRDQKYNVKFQNFMILKQLCSEFENEEGNLLLMKG